MSFLKPFKRILGGLVGFVYRYHRYLPGTGFEAAVFDSIRYIIRRFFRQRQEVVFYGAP